MKTNNDLLTVITVSYNEATNIELTIQSVLSQIYSNLEYIVIDGGSDDGTVDIIKKYADKISYWVSEPDKGIFDAMNKGIKVANGEWINFMNCGDSFVDKDILADVFTNREYTDTDIIFGDSYIRKERGDVFAIKASDNIDRLRFSPIYRHGASFIRTSVHNEYLFDLSQRKFGYALDFHCINIG